jgi:hypothetical protein
MQIKTALAALLATQLAAALPAQAQTCCAVVELRQYITYPGRRDELITLFEREFIESQEAVGIRVLGLFRDFNDPHRFTWLRGFPSMPARKQALGDFYYGPLWKTWKAQANATLYDNDDVLLLKPAGPDTGFFANAATRAPKGSIALPGGLVVATLYHFRQDASAEFIAGFKADLAPLFERSGAKILGSFVSEKSANTFERLPVREDAHVFAWFASFPDRAAYERYLDRLAQDTKWRDQLFASLYKSLARAPETLILEPTARSIVR